MEHKYIYEILYDKDEKRNKCIKHDIIYENDGYVVINTDGDRVPSIPKSLIIDNLFSLEDLLNGIIISSAYYYDINDELINSDKLLIYAKLTRLKRDIEESENSYKYHYKRYEYYKKQNKKLLDQYNKLKTEYSIENIDVLREELIKENGTNNN